MEFAGHVCLSGREAGGCFHGISRALNGGESKVEQAQFSQLAIISTI